MAVPSLKIGSVEFALHTFPVSQEYRPLGVGSQGLRMLSGTAIKQTHFSKLATRISGSGWAPAALAGMDWSASFSISCIEPRSIHSASNVATMPTARRSDFTGSVLARAVVAGLLVDTPVVVVTNTATATAVSGATSYQFLYWPTMTCFSDGPTESVDVEQGVYSWTIDAEEV